MENTQSKPENKTINQKVNKINKTKGYRKRIHVNVGKQIKSNIK